VEKLLDVDGPRRLTAASCLEHQWLTGSYLDTLKQLETTWMRKYLAKRRWQRWFNAVRAMNRMRHLGAERASGSSGPAPDVAALAAEVDLMSPFGGGEAKPKARPERWV